MNDNNKEVVRPVEADGIQEYDNQLPRWWLWLFYFTIAFGVGYFVYKEFLGGETLIEAYNNELAELKEQQESSVNGAGNSDSPSGPAELEEDERTLGERLQSSEYITAGKMIFASTCAPCHGPDGGGTIGPNLTDKYWLHGGTPEEIVDIIAKGVPEKGMVSWLPVLGRLKVEQSAAYVMSLQGTNPTNPKSPQGKLHNE